MQHTPRTVRRSIALSGLLTAVVLSTGQVSLAQGAATGADIPTRFGPTSLLATQTRPTGFGNNQSEINQLFARSDGTNLHIGITGNIEQNGNALVLLLDTRAGGNNTLNYTGGDGGNRINELNGDTFDTGFNPDFILDTNNSGGARDAFTLYLGRNPAPGPQRSEAERALLRLSP